MSLPKLCSSPERHKVKIPKHWAGGDSTLRHEMLLEWQWALCPRSTPILARDLSCWQLGPQGSDRFLRVASACHACVVLTESFPAVSRSSPLCVRTQLLTLLPSEPGHKFQVHSRIRSPEGVGLQRAPHLPDPPSLRSQQRVCGPAKERTSILYFPSRWLHAGTLQPGLLSKEPVSKSLPLPAAVCASQWSLGQCLELLLMPGVPSMVAYKQLLHEHSMMEWALLLSFSCHKNHPLYLGNRIAWIFIGSAFTVSDRTEDSTVRERDAFGWQILWLEPRAIPGCLLKCPEMLFQHWVLK